MTNLIVKDTSKGLIVEELITFLQSCPKDAIVLLNHKVGISNPEDDGSCTYGWVFDPIIEGQCEKIEEAKRFTEYKSFDKIVWLTHQETI